MDYILLAGFLFSFFFIKEGKPPAGIKLWHFNNEIFMTFNIDIYNDDLLKQMKAYLKRSNNIPMQVLNWMTPIEKREQLKSDAKAPLSN